MLKFIRDWYERKMLAEMGAVVDAAPCPPGILYVNLLLFQTIQQNRTALVLNKREPLPAVTEMAPLPPDVTFEKVINRLKVMCALNPVAFPSPQSGTCSIGCLGRDYVISCQFDDQQEAVCTISIAAR
jgi:hypothetical protein